MTSGKKFIIPFVGFICIASLLVFLSTSPKEQIQTQLGRLLTSGKENISAAESSSSYLCFKHLDSLNLESLQILFHGLLTVNKSVCHKFKRFGRNGDGGYEVCMNEEFQPKSESCLVYSFGIRNDWSFDEDISRYGCQVHSFDPSIDQEDHIHPPNISFHKLGLWNSDFVNKDGWALNSLSTIIGKLNHQQVPIDVMKCDTEGAEWPFFADLISSNYKIRQLLVEIHTPRFKEEKMTKSDYIKIIGYFMKLTDLGYALVRNVQNNNCCGRFAPIMPKGVPEKCCYELFFVNSLNHS